MIDFGDDWQNTLVCPGCSAAPCGCSPLTRALEWLIGWLDIYLHYRYRVRQRQLYRRR